MTSARSVVLSLLVSVAALMGLALSASAAPAGVSVATAQDPQISDSPTTAKYASSSASNVFRTQKRSWPALGAGASAERKAGIA